MQESAIYQEIKAEGFQEAVQRERALILRQISLKIGAVPEAERAQVGRLSVDQLEVLGERLLNFSSPGDLSDWLQSDRPTA